MSPGETGGRALSKAEEITGLLKTAAAMNKQETGWHIYSTVYMYLQYTTTLSSSLSGGNLHNFEN